MKFCSGQFSGVQNFQTLPERERYFTGRHAALLSNLGEIEMLSQNHRFIRFAVIGLCLALVCALIAFPALKNGAVMAGPEDAEKQMETLKLSIERPGPVNPADVRKYDRLANIVSDCSPTAAIIKTFKADAPLAPTASLCINGALAVADPNYNRVLTNSTGTGIGSGVVGNCSLSGSGTAVEYDFYSFNLTGCAAFPTEVTATLCGPAGCQHVGNTDTTLIMYRAVAAGDALTANGGLPGVFNPASACTNAVAGSDDLGTTVGTANNPGGATCNQVVGANCVAPCTSPSNAGGLSGMRRQLGNGRFTLVVGGFGNGTTGSYNLYVDVPAAGCAVALAPSAAASEIGGRVLTSNGRGISKVTVSLSGTGTPMIAKTNPFGYYNFPNLEAGLTYTVSVSAKGYTFANPTRIISLQDAVSDADFTSFE